MAWYQKTQENRAFGDGLSDIGNVFPFFFFVAS
jgi:hypothetical protein